MERLEVKKKKEKVCVSLDLDGCYNSSSLMALLLNTSYDESPGC